MKPKDLLTVFRQMTDIATAIDVPPATVRHWFLVDELPEGRQYQFELATNGFLKADKPALASRDPALFVYHPSPDDPVPLPRVVTPTSQTGNEATHG